MFKIDTYSWLDKDFEILSEEDEEIDIDSIKNLAEFDEIADYDLKSVKANTNKINELIKAVKQLNNKIKER